jgi:ribosome assembly protein SQT1
VIDTLENDAMGAGDSDDGGDGDDDGDDDDGVDADGAPSAEPVADESLVQWRSHTAAVYALAASPTAPGLVASGGGDDKAFLWDCTTGGAGRELVGHRDTVNALAFSHDGLYLATAGLDGVVAIWRATDGVLACTLEGPSEAVNWLAWHARGHVLLAGSEDTTCWMWKVPEGECMQIFAAHAASVTCGGFSGDGKSIVTGSDDATVRVWNPRTGQVVHCVAIGAPQGIDDADGAVSCLACHASNPVAIFGLQDGRVQLLHIDKGTILAQWYEHASCVEAVAFCAQPAAESSATPALPLAASVALDGTMCVWDTNQLVLRHKLAHPEGVSTMRWHPSAPLLATAGLDGVARVWDGRSGNLVRGFTGHTQGLLDVLFVPLGPDASALVSSSDDGTARVFRLGATPAAEAAAR